MSLYENVHVSGLDNSQFRIENSFSLLKIKGRQVLKVD